MSASANGLAFRPQPSTPAAEPSAQVRSQAVVAVNRESNTDHKTLPPVSPTPPVPVMPVMRKITHLSRQQILDATEACLIAEGYDGTTIRRIARELGCAVGSIYRYFKDKRELLAAVTHRRFEPVETACEAGLAMGQVQRMYAHVANEQPEQYRLMFWLASVGQSQAGRHLPPVIERLIEQWATRVGDQRQAELQWAQLHGNLMLNEPTPEVVPLEISSTLVNASESIPTAPTAPSISITSTEDLTLL